MPAPVVAAMGVLGLLVVIFGLAVIGAASRGNGSAFVVDGLTAAAAAYAAYGCWRRYAPAQYLAAAGGIALVLFGLYAAATTTVLQRLAGQQDFAYLFVILGAGLAGLVTVPTAARAWFRPLQPHVDQAQPEHRQ
jgi:hypothetical protein